VWSSGDTVALRYLNNGRVSFVRPVTVVEDGPALTALLLRVGTPILHRVALDGVVLRTLPYAIRHRTPWELGAATWERLNVLELIRPAHSHSLWVVWDATWTLRGWYVNLQAKVRRTSIGFDTEDHVLDLWIDADGTAVWKDTDEFAQAIAGGRFSPAEATEVRAEAARVLAEQPWPTGWEEWRPDPAWPLPQLPDGWDRVE
jgi:hypothetical protein